MASNFKIFIALLLILFILGCRKDINLDIPDQEPIFVLNALLKNDSVISIEVTKPVKALSNELIRFIDDASITVADDKNEFTLNHRFKGWYNDSLHKAVAGVNYRISVKRNNFKEAYTSVKVPSVPSLIIANYSMIKQSIASAKVVFNDPASETNYYQICIDQKDTNGVVLKGYINTPETNIDLGSDEFYYNGCYFFNDKLYNGKAIDKRLEFYLNSVYDSLGNAIADYKPLLMLRNLNYEFYIYNWSVYNFYRNQNNPFSEPVQVYTNIKNGIGIVGASSETKIELIKQ
jgi:hypothetical protein